MTEATAAPPADPRRATAVFYDGGCPVCRREIGLYRRHVPEEAVDWLDVAAAPPGAVAPGLDREAAMRRFHVRRADGSIEGGARAFFALWRSIPKLRWAGVAFDRPPFTWVGEVAYRAFLKVRKLWR